MRYTKIGVGDIGKLTTLTQLYALICHGLCVRACVHVNVYYVIVCIGICMCYCFVCVCVQLRVMVCACDLLFLAFVWIHAILLRGHH